MKSSAPHPETAGDGRRRQECGRGAVSRWIRRENFADGGERASTTCTLTYTLVDTRIQEEGGGGGSNTERIHWDRES